MTHCKTCQADEPRQCAINRVSQLDVTACANEIESCCCTCHDEWLNKQYEAELEEEFSDGIEGEV